MKENRTAWEFAGGLAGKTFARTIENIAQSRTELQSLPRLSLCRRNCVQRLRSCAPWFSQNPSGALDPT
jgi:hypothetical protein